MYIINKQITITTLAYVNENVIARFHDRSNNFNKITDNMQIRVKQIKRYAKERLQQLAKDFPSQFCGNEIIYYSQYVEVDYQY